MHILAQHHGFIHIHEWIHRGGYPVLFGVLVCCGLGVPVPEDIPIVTAGVMVFHGEMNIWLAAICAWCGIIGGDCILYTLGRKYGPEVSKIPIIGRHIDTRRIARVEKWFEQYGIWVVAVGRMFAGIRGVMVVVAGTSKFKFWKFIVADGLAAIVSGGVFMLLGYKFAEHMDELKEIISHVKGGMMIGLGVIVVGVVFYLWRLHGKRRAKEHDEPADDPARSKVGDEPDPPVHPAPSPVD